MWGTSINIPFPPFCFPFFLSFFLQRAVLTRYPLRLENYHSLYHMLCELWTSDEKHKYYICIFSRGKVMKLTFTMMLTAMVLMTSILPSPSTVLFGRIKPGIAFSRRRLTESMARRISINTFSSFILLIFAFLRYALTTQQLAIKPKHRVRNSHVWRVVYNIVY